MLPRRLTSPGLCEEVWQLRGGLKLLSVHLLSHCSGQLRSTALGQELSREERPLGPSCPTVQIIGGINWVLFAQSGWRMFGEGLGRHSRSLDMPWGSGAPFIYRSQVVRGCHSAAPYTRTSVSWLNRMAWPLLILPAVVKPLLRLTPLPSSLPMSWNVRRTYMHLTPWLDP